MIYRCWSLISTIQPASVLQPRFALHSHVLQCYVDAEPCSAAVSLGAPGILVSQRDTLFKKRVSRRALLSLSLSLSLSVCVCVTLPRIADAIEGVEPLPPEATPWFAHEA